MDNIKRRPKIDFKVLGRVIGYVTKNYKFRLFIVMACLILTTISSVAGNLFLQTLIDDYIVPLLGVENPVFTSLMHAIGIMCSIYLVRNTF